ncbi:hypothetical protein HanRHA438_Chr15g0694291 [Helianthus annuus]|nr:hypothetical protein HanRHA438_Chr15g0694291 [Helianthus annuus]
MIRRPIGLGRGGKVYPLMWGSYPGGLKVESYEGRTVTPVQTAIICQPCNSHS